MNNNPIPIMNGVERSSTPLNFEYWSGDVELSEKDIDEINLVAFATATNTSSDIEKETKMKMKKRERDDSTPVTVTGTGSVTAPTVSRRKKKPKGMPKRPLSGYNIFFKQERVNVLQEHNDSVSIAVAGGEMLPNERSNVSFQDLGKIIGKRWKTLTEEERKKYENLAQQDSVRYRAEMEVFNETKRKRNEEKNKEAEQVAEEPLKEASTPTAWRNVLSGPPSIKPQLFQHLPLLQARLPGQQQQQLGTTPATFPPQPQPDWQQQLQLQQQQQVLFEGAPTVLSAAETNNVIFPIPPGTELMLPDPQVGGRERKFKVQYKFYTMTRTAAETYMEQLSSVSATAAARVPPPYAQQGFAELAAPDSSARDAHYPYWS